MSSTLFIIENIIWPVDRADLPDTASIWIPGYLTNLGHEDFEPDGTFDHLNDDDDDDDDDGVASKLKDEMAEDFWDTYEPSDQACEAFDAEWDREVRLLLEKQFSGQPVSYGHFSPSLE